MKFISRVQQDISHVDSSDILVNIRNKFHISKHLCIILYIIIIIVMSIILLIIINYY